MQFFRMLCWLLLPLCIGTVQSCCNCGDSISYNYSIQTLHLSNLNNSGLKPFVTSGDSVPKRAYGIRIVLSTTKVACNKSAPSLFLQSAYAQIDCFCPPLFISNAKDTIQKFSIVTLADFDSLHTAGADITDYFFEDGRRPMQQSSALFKSVSFESLQPGSIEIDCWLMHAPQFSGTAMQFLVEIELSDGRNLSVRTTPLTLY